MSYQLGPQKSGVYQNIQLLKANLDGSAGSAIDVGCKEGLITAFLDSFGLNAFGFEGSKEYAEKAASFQNSNFSKAEICCHAMTLDDVKQLPFIDITLFLNVNQKIAKTHTTNYSEQFFIELFEKTNLQLFFQPCMVHQEYGCKQGFIENDFISAKRYFDNVLAKHGFLFDSKIIGVSSNPIPPSEPFRPLILYTKMGRQTEPVYIPHQDDTADTIRKAKSKLCTIEVAKAISSRDLQSFDTKNGYHRFVKTVSYLDNLIKSGGGELNYKSTPLFEYYQQIQPKNFGHLWQLAGFHTDIGPVAQMPLDRYVSWMPWANPTESNEEILQGLSQQALIPEWDSHAFGPLTEQNQVRELQRLYQLLQQISQEGYAPELFPDGYIRGNLLRYKGQTRFLVSAGQHRLAVLAALGFQQIVIKFQSDNRLIDGDDISSFPLVQRGLISHQQAVHLLDGLFNSESSFLQLR